MTATEPRRGGLEVWAPSVTPPIGVDLSFVLRRVPTTADEDPATMPRSAQLPFRRQ